jgi:predicted nucleic acid-binding protein
MTARPFALFLCRQAETHSAVGSPKTWIYPELCWRTGPRNVSVSAADVVLDTSAIFSVLRNEPGADFVEARLNEAAAGKTHISASFVSLTEIFYNTIRLADRRRTDELLALVKSWPVEFIYPDEALCLAAGEIKALFPLSFADAFVAATARETNAVLLHKDPEFESLRGTVKLKALPYKSRR